MVRPVRLAPPHRFSREDYHAIAKAGTTTDGAMYLVDHPELVVVSRTMIVIGTGIDQPTSGIPERLAFCPLTQIARVETFPKAAA